MAATTFRPDLLQDTRIAVARPARDPIGATLTALGAAVEDVRFEEGGDAPTHVHALVVDAAALFTGAGGAGGDELGPLRAAADGAWIATRATANAAWIEPKKDGGKVILIAPRPNDGTHAHAARAALENLARTLSIEWSRYGIRTTTITPGEQTTDEEVAGIVAYLASPAGDYFSGARLDLA